MTIQELNEPPLTFSMLLKFFNEYIEPRFQTLGNEVRELRSEFSDFKNECHQRFDDLYKKFEDLRQEYIISNEQIRRLAEGFVGKHEFHTALADLKAKVIQLQAKIEELERRLSH